MTDDSFITLKEYFDTKFSDAIKHTNEIMIIRLDALTHIVEAKMHSIDCATKIYKDTTDKRLETMNEFREENKALTSKFWTRELHEVYTKAMGETMDKIDGRIKELEKVRYTQGGMASQKTAMITAGISIVSLMISVAVLLFKFL
jgi:hypothetical protein